MRPTPSNVLRQQSKAYPCLKEPEVWAINSRLAELASELLEAVDAHTVSFLETRRFPEHVFNTLAEFRNRYDWFIYEVIRREDIPVTCTKGCSACCYDVPSGVEPLETLDIYRRIRTWPDFETIMRACAQAARTFRQICRDLQEASGKPVTTGSSEYAQAIQDYYLLRIPCAFLDSEQGICRIYEFRPLICRAVFSTVDPGLCDPKNPGFSQEKRRLEIIEPVDEINFVLTQIYVVISEALEARFPETLQHGLLAWHQWLEKRV